MKSTQLQNLQGQFPFWVCLGSYPQFCWAGVSVASYTSSGPFQLYNTLLKTKESNISGIDT